MSPCGNDTLRYVIINFMMETILLKKHGDSISSCTVVLLCVVSSFPLSISTRGGGGKVGKQVGKQVREFYFENLYYGIPLQNGEEIASTGTEEDKDINYLLM